MFATAQQWINDRTAREQVLLSAGLALAVIWGLYAGLWQPLQAREATLLAQIDRHNTAIAMLQAAPAAPATTVATDTRPVPVIITDTAADFALTIRRLEPEGDGARVVLDEVVFDNTILWLDRLDQTHGLRVTAIEIGRRPAPGIVTATLTLQR